MPLHQTGAQQRPFGGKAPLADVPQQHFHHQMSFLGNVLRQSGQRQLHHGGQRQIVEADHGNVVRDAQPQLRKRLYQLNRRLIGGAEKRGGPVGTRHQLPERIRREQFFPAVEDKFLPQLHAAFGKPGSETVQTVTVYVAFVHVVAQKAHLPVHHVPIGIHKTNVIFYNIHVFEKYGVAIPDHQDITWDEFWAICEELAAKMPDGEYPLDLGDRKGWPACQVFENILMGTDPKLYQDFINGSYDLEAVTGVLDTYARLMDYVAPDHSSRDWYEASGQVVAGAYAMQIMGAWMQPLMTSMGQEYGRDYGVFTFPGTDGWFGMCIDGFVVSNDSADVEAGLKWAYNVTTSGVQTAFSALKESISPYSDTPDETYCPLTLAFKNELTSENTRVYPSFTHGTALPWAASTSLQTQIQEFATSSDHNPEFFAKKIVDIMKESSVKGEWNLVD